MKKKILFISTGGTFASIETKQGIKPNFSSEELLDFFPESKKIADIEVLQVCNLDSTNIHPKYWKKIAQVVTKNYEKYDGFIVSHGTDTMEYSASAISFALQNISKPVVFTGSAYPIGHPKADSKINFMDSLRVATNDAIKEVCVCFHKEIIKGTRAKKITNEATKIVHAKVDVFTSINANFIGIIKANKIILDKSFKNNCLKKTKLKVLPLFDSKIGYIKMYPGLDSSIMNSFKNKKVIIIETFGPGSIPFDYSHWLEKIKEFTKKDIAIFITTQAFFGEVDLKKYEVGQRAMNQGAISCYDMTPSTVIVKLMWILGNYPKYNSKQIKKLFLKNLCGEKF